MLLLNKQDQTWESVSMLGPLMLPELGSKQTPSLMLNPRLYLGASPWKALKKRNTKHIQRKHWGTIMHNLRAREHLELAGFRGKERLLTLFCGGLFTSLISPGKGHVCVRYLFSLL